jgi:translocation and assembly module TamB
MRLVRRILIGFFGFVALVAALLAWILLTETGTRWTVAAIQSRMPQLSVTVTDGTFWGGLDLSELEWSMQGASVSARHIGLRWRLDCLPDSLVCLDTVRSDGLRVNIDPEALVPGEAPAEPEPVEKLDLPVAIQLNELKLVDTRVAIAGGPAIDLEWLTSGAELQGAELNVSDTLVRGLAIRLPAGGEGGGEPGTAPEGGESPAESPTDGTLRLPVDIDLAGLALRDFDLAMEDGVDVTLARLDTALSFDDQGLALASSSADGLRVDVPGGADGAPEEAAESTDGAEQAPAGRLQLPLAIRLANLDLTDTAVRVADGPEVDLASLSTGLRAAGDRVDLTETRLEGLRVDLPAAAGTEGAAPATGGDGPLVIEAPSIELPLDLGIDGITLADAVVDQGGQVHRLNELRLAGELVGQKLSLAELRASAPQGRAAVSGDVRLADDWPMGLSFDVTAADLPELGEQRLTGRLTGSLADLGISLQASGGVEARLSGTAKVLTPDVPWSLSLQANRLRWPLAGAARVQASDVVLTGKGDVGSYDLSLNTAVDGVDIPSGDWRINVSGTPERARIQSLKGETLGGRLELTGEVAWAPSLTWDVGLEADNLQPGRWRADLADSRVDASLTAEGAVADDGWRLNAGIESFSGQWRDRQLDVSGRIGHSRQGVWSVDGLVARSGDNRIDLQGTVGEQWDFDAALALSRLDQLWPDLAGRIQGDVSVTGALMEPSVQGAIDGNSLAWQDISLASVAISLDVDRLLSADSEVGVVVEGVERAGNPLGDYELGLTGNRGAHRLAFSAEGLPQAVAADVAVSGGVNADWSGWSGELASGRLALPDGEWRLASAAALDVAFAPFSARVATHCWRRDPASLCLREAASWGPEGGALSAALASFQLNDLAPLLPPNLALNGRVDASVTANWPADGRPTVAVSADTRDGRVTMNSEDELQEPLVLDYNQLTLALDLDPERATLDFNLDADDLGTGSGSVRLDPYSDAQAMDGKVRLDGLRLGPLQPFLPALDELAGRVSVNGDVAGSLTRPAFNGRVALSDGRVAIRGASVPLTEIGLRADVSGQQAKLTGGFVAGEGRADITGDISWADGLNGAVKLTGDRLAFGYPPVVKRLSLSPDLELVFGGESLSLKGRLDVPSGRFVLEDLPAGSVTVSRDEVIVGDDQAIAEPGGMTLESKVLLVLGDDVRFKGMGAAGRLTGSLQLRQIGAAGTEANGEIRLEEGRYEAYGQKLQVRRGRFLFAGPIGEPRLDLEAVRDTGEVIAGLRVSGSANQPEVNIFSEPPMSQADALSYLLTGSGPGEGGGGDQELLAQAAVSLGVFGGDAVGSAVAEKLGVEDFRLRASGSGDDTQVRVSGRITPNLVVSYGVGVFRPENTLTLRYQLTQRLFLEAVSGFDSALDLFYSMDF